MSSEYHRLLLIFVDGIGLASPGPSNPFWVEPTETLRQLLGGPLTIDALQINGEVSLTALDACLGVDGLPQSATGQTALFTGINGAAVAGRHLTGFPGPTLRPLIQEQSIFRLLVEHGLEVTFANAYTEGYLDDLRSGKAQASVTTRSVEAAGLPFRLLAELERGEAVSWDIVRDLFGSRAGGSLTTVSPEEAGRHLAAVSNVHDLTAYETFITDLAGHGRMDLTPGEALRRVDGLLAGVLEAKADELTVLVASDHGNLEDTSRPTHTRNPVPLLAVGPLAKRFSGLTSIVDLTPAIVDCLRR
jgi:2,3-bisphosphoglycerate-independent phosphoglycerate mutase